MEKPGGHVPRPESAKGPFCPAFPLPRGPSAGWVTGTQPATSSSRASPEVQVSGLQAWKLQPTTRGRGATGESKVPELRPRPRQRFTWEPCTWRSSQASRSGRQISCVTRPSRDLAAIRHHNGGRAFGLGSTVDPLTWGYPRMDTTPEHDERPIAPGVSAVQRVFGWSGGMIQPAKAGSTGPRSGRSA